MTDTLELSWEQHRGYLRRLLARLVDDPHQLDDLLQEIWLRAYEGWAAFRGGDVRAWLASIARNTLRAHTRREALRRVGPLDDDLAERLIAPEAGDLADALAVREALAALSPTLREALVLRYYGGLAYDRIADRCGCPVGTARRRVWSAVQRLRAVLYPPESKETPMTCRQLRGVRLLDHVLGVLSADEAAAAREHLAGCPACAAEAAELRRLTDGLDAVQGEHVLLNLHDLSPDGGVTVYTSGRVTNDAAEPLVRFGMHNPDAWVTEHFVAQGTALPLTVEPGRFAPGMTTYSAELPEPVPPGASFQGLAVTRATDPADGAQRTADGGWSYRTVLGQGAQIGQAVIVCAVRLPEGAGLSEARPPADEVREGPRTTVVWRLAPPPQAPTPYEIRYR